MEEYYQLIENLAVNKESMVYANSGPDHAAIVFSAIFRHCKTEVSIFAGEMNGGISVQDKYLKGLESFLAKGGKVRLIVSRYDYKNNPKLYKLLGDFQFFNPDKVKIKEAGGHKVKDTKNKKPIHFCTGDNRVFRIEHDIEKYAAFGSFNDPSEVKELNDLFDELFEELPEVTIN